MVRTLLVEERMIARIVRAGVERGDEW